MRQHRLNPVLHCTQMDYDEHNDMRSVDCQYSAASITIYSITKWISSVLETARALN